MKGAKPVLTCVICERTILADKRTGWAIGHNAEPVKEGRCCTWCNGTVVVPARIQAMREREKG